MKRSTRSVDKHDMTWSWTLVVDQVAQQQTELALEAEEKLKKLQEEVHTAEEALATASWTADGRSYIESTRYRTKRFSLFQYLSLIQDTIDRILDMWIGSAPDLGITMLGRVGSPAKGQRALWGRQVREIDPIWLYGLVWWLDAVRNWHQNCEIVSSNKSNSN